MPKTKEVKQQEAADRQAAHDARTPEQQLALVGTRPGDSYEERCKLLKKMEQR